MSEEPSNRRRSSRAASQQGQNVEGVGASMQDDVQMTDLGIFDRAADWLQDDNVNGECFMTGEVGEVESIEAHRVIYVPREMPTAEQPGDVIQVTHAQVKKFLTVNYLYAKAANPNIPDIQVCKIAYIRFLCVKNGLVSPRFNTANFHVKPVYKQTELPTHRVPEVRQLQEARQLATRRLNDNAAKDKARWDSLITPQKFNVGDHVLMRHENKLSLEYNWKGPFIVTACNHDTNIYKIKDMNGQVYTSWVHTDRLRPIHVNSSVSSDPWYDPTAARAAERRHLHAAAQLSLLFEDDQHFGEGVLSSYNAS
ncbi:hypothetical protein BX666DRAFT_2031865 [Dichotomocladium elegans]|nr:hypothetical protein BX666DRAFT_2031865 [Dichotomocladium elegans]